MDSLIARASRAEGELDQATVIVRNAVDQAEEASARADRAEALQRDITNIVRAVAEPKLREMLAAGAAELAGAFVACSQGHRGRGLAMRKNDTWVWLIGAAAAAVALGSRRQGATADAPGELGVTPLPPNPLRDPLLPPNMTPSVGTLPACSPASLSAPSGSARYTGQSNAAEWIRSLYFALRDTFAVQPGQTEESYTPDAIAGALALTAIAAELSGKGRLEYGHNPAEIAAVGRQAQARWPDGRSLATFADTYGFADAFVDLILRAPYGPIWRQYQAAIADFADVSDAAGAYAAALATAGVGPVALRGVDPGDDRALQYQRAIVAQSRAIADLLGPALAQAEATT